jgi:hypothetical protein
MLHRAYVKHGSVRSRAEFLSSVETAALNRWSEVQPLEQIGSACNIETHAQTPNAVSATSVESLIKSYWNDACYNISCT